MNFLTTANDPSHMAWLAKRKIGSSDVGAILGFNRYASVLKVYNDKVNPEASTYSIRQAAGLYLEPFICNIYKQLYGIELQKHPFLVHPELDWLTATVDRVGIIDGEEVIHELKTVESYEESEWGEQFTDQVPFGYYLQALQQMFVTGIRTVRILALFRLTELRVYVIHYREDVAEPVIARLRTFWFDHVLKRVPPPPDYAHADTCDMLNKLFPPNKEEKIELPERIGEMAREYAEINRQIAELEKQKDLLKPQLIEAMGTAGTGTFEGGKVSRWVSVRPPTMTKESVSVTIRVTLKKED